MGQTHSNLDCRLFCLYLLMSGAFGILQGTDCADSSSQAVYWHQHDGKSISTIFLTCSTTRSIAPLRLTSGPSLEKLYFIRLPSTTFTVIQWNPEMLSTTRKLLIAQNAAS
jgi:hypothetical protein